MPSTDTKASQLQEIGWERYNQSQLLKHSKVANIADQLDIISNFYQTLPVDRYEPESGRYRRHSRGVYLPWTDYLSWMPNLEDPEFGEVIDYDMKGYNSEFLNLDRQYPAIPHHILSNPIIQQIVKFDLKQTMWLANFPKTPLSVGVGSIMLRVDELDKEAAATPNSLHQDGGEVSFTFIHLITRQNVKGGINYIAPTRCVGLLPSEISPHLIAAEFTMLEPLDSFVVHNSQVSHHVSPISKEQATGVGERGILIVAISPLVKQL